MGASLIISAFLAFSLSLSWFSGEQENGMLEDTIEETRAEQEAINQSYQFLTVQMRAKEAKQRTLEGKLETERKKQKKLKRELALEQRKMRMAVEAGTAVDIEGEREKIRKEVEERASQEIAKLEARILTIEQEKILLEENARIGLTASNEQGGNAKDGEGWAQAELARARARKAIAQYRALKRELDGLRVAKETSMDDRIQAAGTNITADDKALAEAKSKRAVLEARLMAAKKALKDSASSAREMEAGADKASARVLVTELDKARRMLRRKIELRDRTISELERSHSAKNINDTEKQTLRSALENKARRIAELEKALNASRTREETLKANLTDNLNNNTLTAKRASNPVDRERIDTLRARILNLQAKLQEVEDKKLDFAEQARAKIEALRRKTQLLETRNLDMEKGLKAGAPLKAKARKEKAPLTIDALKEGAPLKAEVFDENMPLKAEAAGYGGPLKAEVLKEGAPLKAEVFDENMPLKAEAAGYDEPLRAGFMLSDEDAPGLQTKLRGTGLVDLQGQATSYVAQKMIDRNVELEAQLQDTRLQLAEAQSAYREANSDFYEKPRFAPGREDTRAIISRYRKAATTITALNQRNVELEARAGETARALAQAEAARFIIEKLQARNLELEAKFRALERTAFSIEASNRDAAPEESAYNETSPNETIESETAYIEVTPVESIPNEALAIEAAPERSADIESIVAPKETLAIEAAYNETSPDEAIKSEAASKDEGLTPIMEALSMEAPSSEEPLAIDIALEDKKAPHTAVILEDDFDDEAAALPTPLDTLDNAPSPAEPMIVASLEKNMGPEKMIESAIPSITVSAQKDADNDKELYRIIRSMEDMDFALKSMHGGSDARRPSLVEIHEEIRNLKKSILKKVDAGSINLEDVIRYAGENGTFTFYVIKEGDTPLGIAEKKEVYGDPLLWPLIYRYNQSRLNQPDIITSSRLLIIYKHLPRGERDDALQKAQKFGDWDKWTKEDKRVLIEDWIM